MKGLMKAPSKQNRHHSTKPRLLCGPGFLIGSLTACLHAATLHFMILIYISVTVTATPPWTWERTTYIPRGSSIIMKCTATSTNQKLSWSIRLANSSNFRESRPDDTTQDLFNRYGYHYNLQNKSEVIELLVNTTDNTNGTTVRCIDIAEFDSPTILETVLIVYGA